MWKEIILTATIVYLSAMRADAEVHEVQMLNRKDGALMIFDPPFLQIAEGDSVRFVVTDKGHNAETVPDLIPTGAEGFSGAINQELEVTLSVPGLYGIKCKPHFTMGMVMTIAVGKITEVPADFLGDGIPAKAAARFTEQLESVDLGS
jgi:pseudoazurin